MVFNSSGTEETVRNNEKKKLIGKVRKLKIFFARVVKYDIIFIYFKTKKSVISRYQSNRFFSNFTKTDAMCKLKTLRGTPCTSEGE